jgi:solute carrier family 12 (sodium/potassium/chloride transporter), member 2
MTESPSANPDRGASRSGRYGTFEGVFVPTLLTILGAILFLRQGWVVGNAGFGGAVLIILTAFLITGTTGLSLCSITTNIRIGAGGAYSIISRSLGVEIAGSIGIPLYLSQAFAVALYMFAFREGWQGLFPEHPAALIDLALFTAVVGTAAVSARFAFRVQFVVLGLLVLAFASAVGGAFIHPFDEPLRLWGDFPGAPEDGFPGTSYWVVFAIFFTAATGIMAGANMSGELVTPRRSIPRGTIAAILVSLCVYLGFAYWFARMAPPEELVSNYRVMADRALWSPAVIAGLLGATFTQGLVSLVGASRILQALAAHRVIPRGDRLARRSASGEPRTALFLTAGLVAAALLLRELNTIAPLITMFFLITYSMVNVVVLVEQSLGLVSFRPLLAIPRAVPLIGLVGCLVVMLIINPVMSLVALTVVIAVYGYLMRRDIEPPYGDVRSGMFVAIAEWAVKRATRLRGPGERAWKPSFLVPVEDVDELRGTFRSIHDLASPRGSLHIMGVTSGENAAALGSDLATAASHFQDEEVFANWTVIETRRYADGVLAGMGALRGAFLRPNIVFLRLPHDDTRASQVREVMERASDHGLGLVLFADHPRAGIGRKSSINVWVRTPEWEHGHTVAEVDLELLLAYRLQQNWKGRVRILTAVDSEEEKGPVMAELTRLVDLARIPRSEVYALVGDLSTCVARGPQADVSLFGLPADIDFAWAQRMVLETRSTCIFVRGSGAESAVA